MAIADTKGNAGEEEEEEVPAWFRCPISLEIMKDPVSLCTGVTYERCSIEKWLKENNTVCPATMQPLQSLQLTPNHTLRRLIQHWSESPPTSIPAQQPLRSTLQHLIHQTSTASSLLTALQAFNTMAKSRSISLKDEDIVNLLVKLLCSYNDPQVLSQVAEILAFLIEESGGFPSEKFRDVKMLPLVQSLSLASHRHSAVKLLEAMSRDRICARQMSAEEVIDLLLESMDDDEESCRSGAAKTLRNVCMVSRSARVRMAILGGVSRTTEMMNVSRDKRDKALCLCLFDALSTTAEGREAMDDHTMCIGSVVRCLSGVSAEASEHAVGALWRVCVNCEDYDAIVNSGLVLLGIKKLLVLMQMDCCSPTTKLRANRLLKLFNSLTPSLVSTKPF